MLCADIPDPTSRIRRDLMARTEVTTSDLCPWKAHPWTMPDGHGPRVEQIAREAAQPAELLRLTQGVQARWAWAMVRAFRPRYARPEFEVVETCHPLGTRDGSPEGAHQRKVDQEAAWRRAAETAQRTEATDG